MYILCAGHTRFLNTVHNMFQSLSPKLVNTPFLPREYFGMATYLQPEDIADGILYALGTPPHVQVGFCNNKNTKLRISQTKLHDYN